MKIVLFIFVIISSKLDSRKSAGINEKINLNELSKQSDKLVAKQLKEDLENLTWMIQRKEFLKSDVDSDEALLMTLMSKPDHKQRMRDIKNKMKIIDKRYENFLEEIKLPLVKSIEQHPQPATFETMFFNNVNLRKRVLQIKIKIHFKTPFST